MDVKTLNRVIELSGGKATCEEKLLKSETGFSVYVLFLNKKPIAFREDVHMSVWELLESYDGEFFPCDYTNQDDENDPEHDYYLANYDFKAMVGLCERNKKDEKLLKKFVTARKKRKPIV